MNGGSRGAFDFSVRFRETPEQKWIFFFLIYFWLCWVFVSVQGLSPIAVNRGQSSSRCAGLSLSQPLLLQSTGSRCAGSVVVAHGPSCSAACGIFPHQGSNLCLLHWQADSQPLRHQGNPEMDFFKTNFEMSCCIMNEVNRTSIPASKGVSFSVDRQTAPGGAWHLYIRPDSALGSNPSASLGLMRRHYKAGWSGV